MREEASLIFAIIAWIVFGPVFVIGFLLRIAQLSFIHGVEMADGLAEWSRT